MATSLLAKRETAAAKYSAMGALRSLLRLMRPNTRLTEAVPVVAKPRPRNVLISDEERQAMLLTAAPFLQCFILLCGDLALRSGTAARIAPEHYDPISQELRYVTKGGRTMHMPVTRQLVRLFELVPADADRTRPYVQHLYGRSITQHALIRQFARLCGRLGIRGKTPHDLRRSTAVKVMDITKDLRVVQHLLGHTSLDSTLYYLDHDYGHVDRELIEEAAKGRKAHQA
ncbi:tyrosine-type recombinase/integrase [Paracidobacterium acidisoli]|nr:tyrosine-type recombinase/integrase [Paracidobacterium acidisoli]MBT9332479.1 tyrosine-type recombinase/integrase [Paracidobacterium acidisoli]